MFNTTHNPRTIYDFEQNKANMAAAYQELPAGIRDGEDKEKVCLVVRRLEGDALPAERHETFKGGSHWACTLVFQGRLMAAQTFSQGSAHFEPPTADDVLFSLVSDASGTDQPFEDWASDLGYDDDSRSAEKVYKACLATRHALAKLLNAELFKALVEGDFDYDEFEDGVESVAAHYAGTTARHTLAGLTRSKA